MDEGIEGTVELTKLLDESGLKRRQVGNNCDAACKALLFKLTSVAQESDDDDDSDLLFPDDDEKDDKTESEETEDEDRGLFHHEVKDNVGDMYKCKKDRQT